MLWMQSAGALDAEERAVQSKVWLGVASGPAGEDGRGRPKQQTDRKASPVWEPVDDANYTIFVVTCLLIPTTTSVLLRTLSIHAAMVLKWLTSLFVCADCEF